MIPLLFPRLLCHILEHMSYPTEPHLERCHHCREYFTLDQWTQLAERNSADQHLKQSHPSHHLQCQHSLTRHSRSIPQSVFHPPLLHHLCLRPPLLILQLHPLFHKLHLFYHRTLSPYLAQIFMAWYYYSGHSTPRTMLYSGK